MSDTYSHDKPLGAGAAKAADERADDPPYIFLPHNPRNDIPKGGGLPAALAHDVPPAMEHLGIGVTPTGPGGEPLPPYIPSTELWM